jgi:Domain of unknown function (DUF4365)
MLRKRRTREHVIADLAVHHVEGVALELGWAVERILHDYGYDMSIFTYDAEGYAEAGALLVQLKATEHLESQPNHHFLSWTLNVRDVRLWREEVMPMLLIVYDVVAKSAYWLYIQEAFSERDTLDNHLYVRCRIPRQNRLTVEALAELRLNKQAILARFQEI